MGCGQSLQITNEIAEKIIEYLQKNPKNVCIVDFPHFDEETSLLDIKINRCIGEPYYQMIHKEEKGLKQDQESLKNHLVTGTLKEPTIREMDIETGLLIINENDFYERIRKLLKKSRG